MDWKTLIASSVVRKFIGPAFIGVLVVWLMDLHLSFIADAICVLSDGFGIEVNECKELK